LSHVNEWGKIHQLPNLYCSTNNVKMIKAKGIRQVGHVALMGEQ